MNDKDARCSELTYKEHCRILDEITEAGCLWLLYTGGEIFARKDFLDIYTYAKKKGLLISLFTNGTLITPEIADYLVQWRPFSIEITLYGQTKETHDKITGIPGSFKKCLNGVQLLLERNLPLTLKTVVLTLNKHELWEMKSFVEKELGIEFRFDAMISPRLDCSHSPLAVRLKPHEVLELDLQDLKRVEEWKKFAKDLSGYVIPPEQKDKLYQCGGGDVSFAIDPSGRLSICNFLPGNTWDLRKGSFQKGWENFLLEVKSKTITRHTKYVDCEIVAMCGMCPANGELENGDAEEPVDFLCQVAHLRAYAFDIPVPSHGDCEYCEGGKDFRKLMQSVEALHQGKNSTGSNQLLTNICT